MSRIYVLHENEEWVLPLRAAFEAQDLPYREWFLDEARVALDRLPPEGVYYNRMSASSHTRGHRFAPEATRATLQWLELHGRRTVNGSRAIALEVDKLGQYAALQAAGIATPRTVATVGREQVLAAAREFGEWPLILKPNRGGKGLGVRLVHSSAAVEEALDDPAAAPLDGIWLVQQYVAAPEPFITRLEFVGGRFHYAVRVDTSEGFELCPADACELPGQLLPEGAACPAGAAGANGGLSKFSIVYGFRHALIARLERFLAAHGIEVAGVEFIVDRHGQAFVYDVNTNTNYNGDAEARASAANPAFEGGMARLARFLGEQLEGLRADEAA
ncbi:MAG: alpha-L-glutamate ligase [Tistlia sp.]|uniref:RimK family alpha-L-glutamate ligase n=1 Tax=Tistlia sp. TaxID=3057121 RepID=UPI0034A4894A